MADLTFDSTQESFDSTLITFDQSSEELETPAPSGGGKAKRYRFLVRHDGQQHLVNSLDELQAFVEDLKAQSKPKRNKKRPVAQVSATELKAEIQKHDLPNIEPLLKTFDFEGLREVMERLALIQQAIDEEDVEMLVLH